MQLHDSEIGNSGRSERNERRNEQSPSESGESGNSLARSRSRAFYDALFTRDSRILGCSIRASFRACLSRASRVTSACHGSVLAEIRQSPLVPWLSRGVREGLVTITALFTAATGQRREIRDRVNAAGMLRRAAAAASSVHPLHPPRSCSRERSHCLR